MLKSPRVGEILCLKELCLDSVCQILINHDNKTFSFMKNINCIHDFIVAWIIARLYLCTPKTTFWVSEQHLGIC